MHGSRGMRRGHSLPLGGQEVRTQAKQYPQAPRELLHPTEHEALPSPSKPFRV